MYVSLRAAPPGAPAETSTPTAPGRVPGALRRRVPATVVALGVVSCFTDISSESVSAILPLYLTAVLGLSPLAYGFVDGLYQGVSALVRLAGGWWADTTRRPKLVAVTGYAASFVAKLVLLPAAGIGAVTAAVTLDRLGKGLRTGPRDALIASASTPAQLGRDFGVHRSLDTAGALIGPLVAFAVLAAIPYGSGGYRSVFVLSAACALIGLAVLVVVVPDHRRAVPSVAPGPVRVARPRSGGGWAELATPGMRRLLVAAGLLSVATIGDGFLYLALADTGGFGAVWFPLLFVGTNVAYLGLAVPLGRLADRVGRPAVLIGGHVVLLGAYALTVSRLGGPVGIVVVLLLLGAFYAATDGVLAALASQLVPERRRASGIASAQTVVAVGRLVSSIGFGLMWQLIGRPVAIGVMAAVLVLVLPVAVWLLRPSSTRGPLSPAVTA